MKLGVYFTDLLVGELEQTRSATMQFQYSPEWLEQKDSFALSFSLPKTDKVFQKQADFFFSNLLPEGLVREAVCRRLGISIDNDFSLLEKVGGECAGALTISKEVPEKSASQYEPLSEKQLDDLAQQAKVYATVSEREDIRLSLAGAQDKLPIFLQEDQYFLPIGTSPSSHIIKFISDQYKGIIFNECYITQLANLLGLNTIEPKLKQVGKQYVLLVPRYDRIVDSEGNITRLHQEDLCQALGISYKTKYQNEGGPSFKTCYELVKHASNDPLVDNHNLLQWQIFNVLAGNCDGHAKNISLLRTTHGKWRLTPFYDLVSTIFFPRVSRNLAMGIANQFDIGNIAKIHWQKLAKELDIGQKLIETIFLKMLSQFPDALNKTHEAMTQRYGEIPTFDNLKTVLIKHHRRHRNIWNG